MVHSEHNFFWTLSCQMSSILLLFYAKSRQKISFKANNIIKCIILFLVTHMGKLSPTHFLGAHLNCARNTRKYFCCPFQMKHTTYNEWTVLFQTRFLSPFF